MIKKLILISTLLILSSCNSKQYFSVVVWNKSGIKLKNILVWDNGEKAYSFGSLPPDIFGVRDFMYTPLSEDVKLTWAEADTGIEREVQVDIIGIIPKNYNNGVVHFTIESADKVSVNFYYRKPSNF